MDSRDMMEDLFHLAPYSVSGINLNMAWCCVQMIWKDKFYFFTVKNFALQAFSITLWGNADEMLVYFHMPSGYSFSGVHAKYAVKH